MYNQILPAMHHTVPYGYGNIDIRHRVTNCLVQLPLDGQGLLITEALQ